MSLAKQRCLGCRGCFADTTDDDSHAYMLSSSGCWSAYGVVLTREYQDPALFARCHRFTVDAYAVQHRGNADEPRAVRSVWLHFAALDVIFGRGGTQEDALSEIRRLAAMPLPALPAATPVFPVSLEQVVAAGPQGHAQAVEEWARSAYYAWQSLLADRLPRR